MANLKRRPFLGAALAGIPFGLMSRPLPASSAAKIPAVRNGEDRAGERHTIGVSSTGFKVLTKDTDGGLFVIEHTNRAKGGPPRHLHHGEDEWFYAVEGRYVVEVASERYEVNAGDSILAPRGVPHAWAFAGETVGRMVIAFAPAGKMEAFFRDNEKRLKGSQYSNDAEMYRAYGLELLGPPLEV